MDKKVVSYFPTHKRETDTPNLQPSIAIVTKIQNDIPVSVTLNEISMDVIGYLSLLPGMMPNISLGDKVLISTVQEGVLIHGVVMPVDAKARASFGLKGDTLVIEALGSVLLKNEHATIELTQAGAILIDGKDVRTIAEQTLTLLGGKVEMN